MAVLKDLIVHGRSRFVNGASFNTINAESIGADAGIFNKLVATTLDATTATIDDLTAKNATVTALLDVQGDMQTNSWSNSNIATIDGSFYITPTSLSADGNDVDSSSYTPTGTIVYNSSNTNFTKITVTGTFDTSQLTLNDATHVPWPAGSEVIITGDVLVGNEWLPLGTIRGKLESQVAASNASKQISIIPLSATLSDGHGNKPMALEAIRVGINLTNGTSSTLKMRKIKVSLTSRANGSTQYPVGILLTAQGTGTGQTFIDIYGGNEARNGQSGTINGTTKTFTKPTVRLGNLEGLPKLANQTPSGWGIYTSNGFFEGAIVAKEGYIGNTGSFWTIGGGTSAGATYMYSGPSTIGATTTEGTYLGTNGFLNVSAASVTNRPYAQITGGVLIAQGAVIQGSIDASSFKARDANQKVRTEVNTNGLLIYDSDGTTVTNGTMIAQFGSTVQIGKSGQAHINLTSGGLDLYKGTTSEQNLAAHLGYGSTTNTTNIIYYSFGQRGTGINDDAGYDYSGIGQNSFASGYFCVASGNYSHAEGQQSIAYGVGSHAEGAAIMDTGVGFVSTMAIGAGSHAEGAGTRAFGHYSHTEGYNTVAHGNYSHVGGESSYSASNAIYSFAHGAGVRVTAPYQAVFGKYNEEDGDALFVIGNGTLSTNRSNLMTVGDNLIRIGNNNNGHILITPSGLSGYGEDQNQIFSIQSDGISGTFTTAIVKTLHINDFPTTASNALTIVCRPGIKTHYVTIYLPNDELDMYNANSFDKTTSKNYGTAYTETLAPSYTDYDPDCYFQVHYDGDRTITIYLTDQRSYNKYVAVEVEYSYEGSNPIYNFGGTAEGISAVTFGEATIAKGRDSIALGYNTIATSNYACVGGRESAVGGAHSIAYGFQCITRGHQSQTFGSYNSNNFNFSTVFGTHNQTRADNQFIIGTYNEVNGISNQAFIIGNGKGSNYNPSLGENYVSNAFAVDWQGNITISDHTSSIGTIVKNWLGTATSVPHNTPTGLFKITLDKGTWIVVGGARFPSNATGVRRMCLTNAQAASDIQLTQAAVSGAVTQMVLTRIFVVEQNNYDIWLNVLHTAGSALSFPVSGDNWGNYITAIRIL